MSRKKKGRAPISAAELMRRLAEDPEFVASQQARDAERQRRGAELLEAEAPLVEALRGLGYSVASVWDLVNSSSPYPGAFHTLLEHLVRPYPAPVREGIARALAVEAAGEFWGELKGLYLVETEEQVRQGLAAALAASCSADTLDEVIALIESQRRGSSRLILLGALERLDSPRALQALKEFASDPDLRKEARFILNRLGQL